ncbi:MAG: hypothetical protein ACKVJP_09935, partial [Flavobacteriales bacterium]
IYKRDFQRKNRVRPIFISYLFCFSIWNIFYYVFLYLILIWTSYLFTWDLLFLIPVPWIGPVIISLLMVVLSFILVKNSRSEKPVLLNKIEWLLLFILFGHC